MLVHLFGGLWSPSCASFALLKTTEQNSHLYDAETVETVQKKFYVDDCLKSVQSEDEAIKLYRATAHHARQGWIQPY